MIIAPNNSTWGTNEDDVEDLVRVGGVATPQNQLLEQIVFVSVSIETNLVIGPVRVVDLIAGGDDELLIDAGQVTSLEGDNNALRLITTVIKT